MTPEERERCVDALPLSVVDLEASPPEGDAHFLARVGAYDALTRFYKSQRRHAYVASELATYYPDEAPFSPDLLVVFDVDIRPRTRWVVSAEGRGLDFVLEVHYAGDWRKDIDRNVGLYARVGIPEYVVFDKRRGNLHGHRLQDGRYTPILPQYGRYESVVLGLDLAIEGDRLRFLAGNAPLLDAGELIDRLGRELDSAAVRQAESDRAKAESDRARAESEVAHAAAVEARDALAARVAALEAELERARRGD